MTRDTSLDEFAGTAEEGDTEGDDGGHPDEIDDQFEGFDPENPDETTPVDSGEAEADTAEAPEGPTPTYGFDPDGRCAVCEESAPTRYRQGGDWVCADCKDW